MSTGPKVVAINAQSSTTVATPFLAYDWAITVAWASSDLDSFKPLSAPLSLFGATPTTGSAAPTNVPPSRSQPAASTPSHTGPTSNHTSASVLSTGAKAGIGVGAGLGCLLVFLLGAILVVMLRKQRRNRRAAGQMEHGGEASRFQSSAPILPVFTNQGDPKYGDQYKYTHAEMEGTGRGQQYPFAKPELEDTRCGERYRSTQAELEGS